MAPPPRYHPVVHLPPDYEVLDFTQGAPKRASTSAYTVGRYGELRRGMYTQAQFSDGTERRELHVGVDLGCPAGTAVHAFSDCTVLHVGCNDEPGDYGPTVVTHHREAALYALHGHLARRTLRCVRRGQCLARGDVLGWVGDADENGGWPPHVHFQLSRRRPVTHDMPGVVAVSQRAAALALYPDPRLVLGDLYPPIARMNVHGERVDDDDSEGIY